MRWRLIVPALLGLIASQASAYTLETSLSESCHERLTFDAIGVFLAEFDQAVQIAVPGDRVTRRLMASVRRNLPPGTSDAGAFIAMSVVIGVRAPDTEGHSTLNLAALRSVHADPSDVGQYAHALRAIGDDGLVGELNAVEGTRQAIRDELTAALEGLGPAPDFTVEIAHRRYFVDHYQTVEVPVALAAYHVGRAIHALQDSHAHMVRVGERFEHVVHVTNYVEAVNGTLEAHRDGLAHSNALDNCHRNDVAPIAAQARVRTAALALAFTEALANGDLAPIERGLAPCPDAASRPEACGWIEYRPACAEAIAAEDTSAQTQQCCTASNAFCRDTVPAMAIARQQPAEPYLACSARPGARQSSAAWLMGLAGVLLGLLRRRFGLSLLLAVGLLAAGEAHARPTGLFIATDGHAAGIDDTPNGSFLDLAVGYSVRVGRRFGRWRAIGMVERSYWIPVEYGVRVDGGVLNLGVGAEALFFDDYFRAGIAGGACILMFDAVFNDAGATGIFVDVRPAGLRYAVLDDFIITFDPLTISLQQPVLRDPPIRKLHRRISAGVEWVFN